MFVDETGEVPPPAPAAQSDETVSVEKNKVGKWGRFRKGAWVFGMVVLVLASVVVATATIAHPAIRAKMTDVTPSEAARSCAGSVPTESGSMVTDGAHIFWSSDEGLWIDSNCHWVQIAGQSDDYWPDGSEDGAINDPDDGEGRDLQSTALRCLRYDTHFPNWGGPRSRYSVSMTDNTGTNLITQVYANGSPARLDDTQPTYLKIGHNTRNQEGSTVFGSTCFRIRNVQRDVKWDVTVQRRLTISDGIFGYTAIWTFPRNQRYFGIVRDNNSCISYDETSALCSGVAPSGCSTSPNGDVACTINLRSAILNRLRFDLWVSYDTDLDE